jgi:Ca-activated chloride channel family protein
MQTNRPTSTPKSNWNARSALILGLLLALTLTAGLTARGLGVAAKRGGDLLPLVAPGGGPVHLSARLDRSAVLRGGDGIVRVELAIRGDAAEHGPAARVPTDLVVVLDRSGSMQGPPIESARAAVRELVAQIGPGDRFALVSYASDARVDVPLAPVGANRDAVLAAISRLEASGGTNMSSGLDLGTGLVAGSRGPGRAPRVVLLSDGHANEGDSSFAGLAARAKRAVADEFVLSAVGVGDGFDEALMSGLADAGTGNFYYLRDASALGNVFSGEFGAARATVASALVVRLDPPQGVEVLDAAGYPLDRDAGTVSFRPGSLFAGQERRVWVTFRVPASGDGPFPLGGVALDFSEGGARRTVRLDEMPSIALVESEKAFVASVDRSAWEQSASEDELGQLKQRVSQAISAGDRASAASEIDGYVSRNRRIGAALSSKVMADQLDEVRKLGVKVEEAFAPSPEAPSRQNQLKKQLAAEGRDDRRAGSKKP